MQSAVGHGSGGAFAFASRRGSALVWRPMAVYMRTRRGRLAQLVERLLYTQDVGGSSPSLPTIASGLTRPAPAATKP